MAAENMAKQEEKGGEEWTTDKRAELESDMAGKLLMAGWRGTKLEVNGVIRYALKYHNHNKSNTS